AVLRRVRPDVLVGLGGYISFPGALVGLLCNKPLLLHEANSVAGSANRLLARLADRVFTAFPDVLANGECVGNPLRPAFLQQPSPEARFAGRSGPLRLLVVGGSLGARALNVTVPQALALLPVDRRPSVTHQSGEKQIEELRANYARAGVQAELTPFISDTASAYAQADLLLCRAGASTVTELAAVGAAALLVPFPAAVDNHQTGNARFLVERDAAWLLPQAQLTPERLAQFIRDMDRAALLQRAVAAKALAQTQATAAVVAACEELACEENRA
ncbi:MAG: UDP-N-acetylglucosamine--N-acetylmuramyl-(pentapeptide) pyrophosphoryl-undecaprenol N-acetylglucosamine transferase, partial [Rhodoferax sp.]|nr:UDP-N-acetylglucosamine--N-acetylmuramyl-(pentapeptide) pyrophosphoryl-undecaprenol N-acetylglucosamine transferase [Rhodoferax sp.]